MDTKRITKNSDETSDFGKEFALDLKPGDVLLLYGELGAGKTTFVQGLAKGLGIKDRILSPTFVLERIHKVSLGNIKTLNHIDLYRLEEAQAIESLGLSETVDDSEAVTIIEWADRLTNFKPNQGYSLRFEYLGEDEEGGKMDEDLKKAIEIIKQGGIVIYPTDTAFGIGCRVDNEASVKRLFEIRKRPPQQATPVLFDSIDRVKEYVLPFDEKVEELMTKHWPGALTIVLPCQTSKIPSFVRGGGENLGVRIPDHEAILSLIKGADVPILGPSANFHGDPTPYEYLALDKDLIKLVDFVLTGKTKGFGRTSTVVDTSKNPWEIIRQGQVKL